MRMPWQNKTGLAKAAVIFASILTVSVGLCGINGLLATGSMSSDRQLVMLVFIVAGVIELIAIVVSLIGLVVILLIAVGKYLHSRSSQQQD